MELCDDKQIKMLAEIIELNDQRNQMKKKNAQAMCLLLLT